MPFLKLVFGCILFIVMMSVGAAIAMPIISFVVSLVFAAIPVLFTLVVFSIIFVVIASFFSK